MQLTMAELKPFVGGQLEEQCQLGRHLYRSRVRAILIDGDKLKIMFDWSAQKIAGHWMRLNCLKSDGIWFVLYFGENEISKCQVVEQNDMRIVVKNSEAKTFTFVGPFHPDNIKQPEV